MTSLIPLYLKSAYKTEPLFENSKVVFSAYNSQIGTPYDESFLEKASINNLESTDLSAYTKDGSFTLLNGAIQSSDAVIVGSDSLGDSVLNEIKMGDKPVLGFPEEEEYLPTYLEFYKSLLEEETVES